MSTQRSKLVASVMRYAGDAADAPLSEGGVPLQTVFTVLLEIEDGLLRDLDLSDQNRRVDKFEVPLNGTSFTVSRADFTAAAYAYVQLDSSSPLWYPVEIANHSALNQAGWDNKLAVAFYGSPQRGEISWEPEAGQTLQVWFDRSGEANPLPVGTTDIASLYDSHLSLQAAAQVRELMGLPVGDMLKARLVKGERQWERFVTTSRQQGVIEKPMVLRPRRMRHSPSRFFLP